ncbi:MAG: hypothetical protein LBE60_14510 [Microbacterium sp.]|jgi:hypothetical protein|uniref:hypothetical protein n=1 Tax=Microbacterium sp. TaxID=51671 RepID=UPI0028313706|nr:hypothetical protein [Microbacterium sp.]MDR2322845.1 hypothetical protein [Microbacterium sp.]
MKGFSSVSTLQPVEDAPSGLRRRLSVVMRRRGTRIRRWGFALRRLPLRGLGLLAVVVFGLLFGVLSTLSLTDTAPLAQGYLRPILSGAVGAFLAGVLLTCIPEVVRRREQLHLEGGLQRTATAVGNHRWFAPIRRFAQARSLAVVLYLFSFVIFVLEPPGTLAVFRPPFPAGVTWWQAIEGLSVLAVGYIAFTAMGLIGGVILLLLVWSLFSTMAKEPRPGLGGWFRWLVEPLVVIRGRVPRRFVVFLIVLFPTMALPIVLGPLLGAPGAAVLIGIVVGIAFAGAVWIGVSGFDEGRYFGPFGLLLSSALVLVFGGLLAGSSEVTSIQLIALAVTTPPALLQAFIAAVAWFSVAERGAATTRRLAELARQEDERVFLPDTVRGSVIGWRARRPGLESLLMMVRGATVFFFCEPPSAFLAWATQLVQQRRVAADLSTADVAFMFVRSTLRDDLDGAIRRVASPSIIPGTVWLCVPLSESQRSGIGPATDICLLVTAVAPPYRMRVGRGVRLGERWVAIALSQEAA